MKAWKIMLAVYLILCGVFWLVPAIAFPGQGLLTGVIAIIAAILLLVDRSATAAT